MMRPEFEVHMLNDNGKVEAKIIADAFNELLDKLVNCVPEGRYLAIVRTKLEEACFYAKKGMATINSVK